jgi:hypothetical protein
VYEHLNTWTAYPTDAVSFRLDLWDTGRTRDGKSELRYALFIYAGTPDGDDTALFEGEDFRPSPLHAIDSDETAAGLLSFFSNDGERLAYGYDADELIERYTAKQRELLEANRELLSLWQYELEGGAE